MEENSSIPAAPQTPPPSTPASTPPSAPSQGMSHDTKALIVILLLIFAYGIGLIFMWLWMKTWPKWVKILITLPAIASLLLIALGVVFYVAQPPAQTSENGSINNETVETPTPSPFDQNGTPSPTASSSAVQSQIEDVLNSKNYAALESNMAESVNFTLYASECCGLLTPEESVAQLSYLDTASPPWDFDQTNPIVESIKTQNSQEYGNLFIGISSNDVMAAFGFDQNNNINIIKVAVTYKLLVTE